MLTLAECRALYDGCGDSDKVTLTTATGSFEYDPWCPCYDADGSNVGTKVLSIFAEAESSWTCEGLGCAVATPMLSAASTSAGSVLGPLLALLLPLCLMAWP